MKEYKETRYSKWNQGNIAEELSREAKDGWSVFSKWENDVTLTILWEKEL